MQFKDVPATNLDSQDDSLLADDLNLFNERLTKLRDFRNQAIEITLGVEKLVSGESVVSFAAIDRCRDENLRINQLRSILEIEYLKMTKDHLFKEHQQDASIVRDEMYRAHLKFSEAMRIIGAWIPK